MLTILKSYQQGFSKETIILPTFLIQSGFFRNRTDQVKVIKNNFRSEELELNNLQTDIKHGALAFSEMLKIHQHTALNKSTNETITLDLKKGSDQLIRACKIKSNYTISEITESLKVFCKDLSPENEISVTNFKKNKKDTFNIFSKLTLDTKNQTISYAFSEAFLNFLNKEKNAITYIQIDEFIKVASNKTGGVLYLITQSISNMTKEKFFTNNYLSDALGIYKNHNRVFNNALKNLKEKGFLAFEKIVKAKKISDNKWLKWSIYKIKDIAKKTFKVKSKTFNSQNNSNKAIEINSKLLNTKKGRQIFNDFKNGILEDVEGLNIDNKSYLKIYNEIKNT